MGRVGTRRVVVEGLVVALAVGGAYLLRERGLHAVSSAGAVGGFDPLIAAVPVLVGIAAGIVVVRLYPIALRGAWPSIARRGRGLVLVLAARRATEGGASSAVLLVLLATATVAAFAAVVARQPRPGRRRGGLAVGRRQLPPPDAERRAPAQPRRRGAAGGHGRRRRVRGRARRSAAARAAVAVRHRGRGPDGDRAGRDARGPAVPRGLHDARGRARSRRSSPRSSPRAPRGVKLGEAFPASVEGFNLDLPGRRGARRRSRGCRAVGPGSLRRASGSWPRPRRPGSCRSGRIVDAPDDGTADALRAAVTAMSPGGRDHQPGRGGGGAPHGARDPGRPGAHPRRRARDGGLRGARRRRRARPVGHRPDGRGRPAADARADRPPGGRPGGRRARPDHRRRASCSAACSASRCSRCSRSALGLGRPRRLAGRRPDRPRARPAPADLRRHDRRRRRRARGSARRSSAGWHRPPPYEEGSNEHDAVPSPAHGQTEIEDLPTRRLGDPAAAPRPLGRPRAPVPDAGPRAAQYGDGAVIACDGLVRIYKQAELEVVALQGLDLLVERRRDGRDRRRVGQRQVHAARTSSAGWTCRPPGRAVVAGYDLGRLSATRSGPGSGGGSSGSSGSRPGRNLLPYLTAAENVELPMVLDGRKGRQAPRARAARARRASATARPTGPTASAAASSSGSRSRWPWPTTRAWSSPTSRPASSTARRRATCSALLRRVNPELGTTIVIVTHDASVSEQVQRTVAIRDGRTSTRDAAPHRADRRAATTA